MFVQLASCVGLVYEGGTGMSGMDGMLIVEAIAYGCSGISTAILSNDLAVSAVYAFVCVCVLLLLLYHISSNLFTLFSANTSAGGWKSRAEEEILWKDG